MPSGLWVERALPLFADHQPFGIEANLHVMMLRSRSARSNARYHGRVDEGGVTLDDRADDFCLAAVHVASEDGNDLLIELRGVIEGTA